MRSNTIAALSEKVDSLYTITIFSEITPFELSEKLTTIRFKVNKKTKEVFWQGEDGRKFIISPFQQQSRNGLNGYRIFSNYPISTILYLIDGALGWVSGLKIAGIEFEIPLIKSKKEHLDELINHPSLIVKDVRGIFSKNDVGIVLLQDKIVLQRRHKLKKLNEELREIEAARDVLFPSKHDLFSFLDNQTSAVV